MSFKKLHPLLKESLENAGFETSNTFQKKVLPTLKGGADTYVIAPKGSGKTTALIIAIIHKLKAEAFEDSPRAIVIVKDKADALVLMEEFDRFTKNTRKAYMIEDRLYIYNPGGMDTINIRGVFEDPEEVAKFECDGSDCYDDSANFPLPMDMVQAITDGLAKGTFMMIAQSLTDTENDTLPVTIPPKQAARGKRD